MPGEAASSSSHPRRQEGTEGTPGQAPCGAAPDAPPDSAEASFAAQVERWAAPLDVLADPDQIDAAGRVWTDAHDVTPSAQVRPDVPMRAGWEDLTFTALPEWDDTELDTLWLIPLDEPTTRPEAPTAAIHEALATLRDATDDSASLDIIKALEGELNDLVAGLRLLTEAVRRHRNDVRQALAHLEATSGNNSESIIYDPWVAALYAMARRTPPRADA